MEKCGHLELKNLHLIRNIRGNQYEITHFGKSVIVVTFLFDVAVHNPWLTPTNGD